MWRCKICLTVLAVAVGAALFAGPTWGQGADPAFETWKSALKAEALSRGITESTFDSAFEGVQPIPRIIELDRRQPEFTLTFWNYMDRLVTDTRVTRGREMLRTHADLLAGIERKYGVQPRFLVAFWGLETNFGDNVGDFPVIAALATLAYDERRSAFFRSHLFDALKILQDGHITADRMVGSWAGAMGQVQFMPETFRRYAVDHTGDGRRDIWQSLPDAFASAANFLSALGWDGTKTWGREVRLPADFDWQLAARGTRLPLAEWSKKGVRRMDGGALPNVDIDAAVVLPGGHRGPAFLIYPNFRAIMGWNPSRFYAVAVGHLADRITGGAPLATARPANDQPLHRNDIFEIQMLLNRLGFDAGEPDGIVGSMTRKALSGFQAQIGEPPDGYPTHETLIALRAATGSEPQVVPEKGND